MSDEAKGLFGLAGKWSDEEVYARTARSDLDSFTLRNCMEDLSAELEGAQDLGIVTFANGDRVRLIAIPVTEKGND